MPNARKNLTRALAAALGCALLAPASSLAQNALTVEPHPEWLPPAPVVTDTAGNGYVAWVQHGSPGAAYFCVVSPGTKVCKHRTKLPFPKPGSENEPSYTPTQAFAVLGEAGEVVVLAPRFAREDALLWVSRDGGADFEAPIDLPTTSAAKWASEIEDVAVYHNDSTLREDLEHWLIVTGNDNGGETGQVGYTGYGEIHSVLVNFAGETLHPSLALEPRASAPPEEMVVAFWNHLGNSEGLPTEVEYRYAVSNEPSLEKEWTAPLKVSNGDAARLAEGPHGVFLMSVDSPANATSSTVPTKVDVRRWNAVTKKFSSPLKLETVPATAGYLFTYGAIGENPSTGRVDVAYPDLGRNSVQFWEVGETKTGALTVLDHRTVARFSGTLSSESPMRLAVAPNGGGWLSFQDGRGDQVANLKAYPALAGKFVAGHHAARTLTVAGGTSPKLEVLINGSRRASGKVKFQGFASPHCNASSKRFAGGASVVRGVAVGKVGRLRRGAYYVKAQYSGDSLDVSSASRCSLAKLIVR